MFCFAISVSAWLWLLLNDAQIGSALCADAAREEGRGWGNEQTKTKSTWGDPKERDEDRA